jgi:hypothetical protein
VGHKESLAIRNVDVLTGSNQLAITVESLRDRPLYDTFREYDLGVEYEIEVDMPDLSEKEDEGEDEDSREDSEEAPECNFEAIFKTKCFYLPSGMHKISLEELQKDSYPKELLSQIKYHREDFKEEEEGGEGKESAPKKRKGGETSLPDFSLQEILPEVAAEKKEEEEEEKEKETLPFMPYFIACESDTLEEDPFGTGFSDREVELTRDWGHLGKGTKFSMVMCDYVRGALYVVLNDKEGTTYVGNLAIVLHGKPEVVSIVHSNS